MPFVEVKMIEGRSLEQKRKVADGITAVITKELGNAGKGKGKQCHPD